MKKYTLLTLSLLTLHAPLVAFAKGVYTPLVGIPGVNPTSDFNTYINALYLLSISVAALLAVIKIVIAGVKWMMTDVVTSKGEAKKDIQGALIGLLIVLAAVLILNVINPKLTNVNLQIDPVSAVPNTGSGTVTLNTNLVKPGTLPGVSSTQLQQNAPNNQKTAFTKDCYSQGKEPKTLRDHTLVCIDIDPQKKTIILNKPYCGPQSSTTTCDTIKNNLKRDCENDGTKNGVYTEGPVDANGYRTYTCVKDRF